MTDKRPSLSQDVWCSSQRLMKLIAFYLSYYFFLFVIFKLSIHVSKTTLPGKTGYNEARGFVAPKTQKMMHSPAMNIFPISHVIESSSSAENLIDLSDPGDTSIDATTYGQELQKFFDDYEKKIDYTLKTENADKYSTNCRSEASTSNKICVPYDKSRLNDIKEFCGKTETRFGYMPNDGGTHIKPQQPCFLANINKIVNWRMQGLLNTDEKYLQDATAISSEIYDSNTGLTQSHINITRLGQLFETKTKRNSGYFGCYAFKMEPETADKKSKIVVKWDSTVNDTTIIEWSKTGFNTETNGNLPDNSLPAYFYPFKGNNIKIDYDTENTKYKLTTSTIDKRGIDYNWLHPFRAFKVNLGDPARMASRFGENTVGLHFECNFYCANCLSTVYNQAMQRMEYPTPISTASNQQSQISFKIKFKK